MFGLCEGCDKNPAIKSLHRVFGGAAGIFTFFFRFGEVKARPLFIFLVVENGQSVARIAKATQRF